MIILDATNRSLQVLLDGTVATNQLPIVASFVDFADGFVPGASEVVTNNTTAVTAVVAPATGVQRQVKLLAVFNADTAPAIVTVRYSFNGTMRTIFKVTLAVGDNLIYTDGEGFRVIDASGQTKQSGSSGTNDHTALSHLSWAASGHTGTASRFPHFDGSGAADLVAETGSGNVVRDTSPTILTPTIASFANANHSHQNAAGGGTLDAATLASGTVGTARLGSGTANSGTFLRGDQTWAAVGGSADAIPGTCGGRLTLASGTPVTTSDVTGAGTLYFTPHLHNRVALFDGSAWQLHTFAERSLSLTLTAGKNYDVFLHDNAGTLTLELSAAWTNDTTRADSLTRQDGVYVKDGATNKLYLGTIRASGTNITEDSFGGSHQSGGKRFIWNAYNRFARPLGVKDTTDSWTYTSATLRQANAATGNKVEYVCGILLDAVKADVYSNWSNPSGVYAMAGIGVDSTTVNSAQKYGRIGSAVGNHDRTNHAYYRGYPGIGYHALNWLEACQATGSTTWYGDNGGQMVQSGLDAEVWA